MEYYRSEGNPEIPESVPSYTFPQTPEGWTLLGGDTVQVGTTLEKYQNQDGEVLALLSTTGPATLFEVETGTTHFYLPFTGGMGWAELEDKARSWTHGQRQPRLCHPQRGGVGNRLD